MLGFLSWVKLLCWWHTQTVIGRTHFRVVHLQDNRTRDVGQDNKLSSTSFHLNIQEAHIQWNLYAAKNTAVLLKYTTKNRNFTVSTNFKKLRTYVTTEDRDHTLCLNVNARQVDRDSSVGLVTRYGLGGPGINRRWRQNFPHPSRPTLRPTLSREQRVPGLFPRGNAVGAWHWPPTPI